MRKILSLLSLLLLPTVAIAQTPNGPRFKSDGSISAPTATYSINGTTGIITSKGLILPSQSSNTFYAAPAAATGAPTFRPLVSADIPALNSLTVSGISNFGGSLNVGSAVLDAAAVGTRLLPTMTTAQMQTASAVGPVIIDQPITIPSSITFTNGVQFKNNGQLTISSGAVVTFTVEPTAPDAQIFYGAGSVAGLPVSKEIWFAGSLLNSSTDSLALLQKGLNATIVSGEVDFPVGSFTITGATPLSITTGALIKGAGKFHSTLIYSSPTTNGFSITNTIGTTIDGISLAKSLDATVPTAGTAIYVNASYTRITNVIVRGSFNAIEVTGVSATRIHDFDLLDSMNIGLYAHSLNDLFIDHFTISATGDWLAISGLSGTVNGNDRLVGATSGAGATVIGSYSATSLKAQVDNANFTPGETVNDTTSGAHFVLTSQTTPHALGGIRLYNQVEAFTATVGDIIGGTYGMTVDAANNAISQRPAYSKFTSVYFDSSDGGVNINNAVEFDFNDCWFSNRPGSGIALATVDGVRFAGGGAINNGMNGVSIGFNAKHTSFSNFAARGNSTDASNTYSGIDVQPNTTDFTILGSTLGGSIGFGTQKYGVIVESGSSDRYTIMGNMTNGNGTGGVSDSGTGTNKTVSSNF